MAVKNYEQNKGQHVILQQR